MAEETEILTVAFSDGKKLEVEKEADVAVQVKELIAGPVVPVQYENGTTRYYPTHTIQYVQDGSPPPGKTVRVKIGVM